jgi:hypothetical protein
MPHPAGMMAKFAKCGDCHGVAHDVNNWPSQAKPEASKDDSGKKETPKKEAPKKSKKQ